MMMRLLAEHSGRAAPVILGGFGTAGGVRKGQRETADQHCHSHHPPALSCSHAWMVLKGGPVGVEYSFSGVVERCNLCSACLTLPSYA